MKNITILDESFDLNLSAIYQLSFQLSPTSYSFCILNSVRNRYIALKHFSFPQPLSNDNFNKEIKKLLENDEFLNKRYKTVKFVWVSTKHTLVPGELFKEDETTKILGLNTILDSSEEQEKTRIDDGKIIQLFAFPSYLATILATQYKDVQLYNQTSSLINKAVTNLKNIKPDLPTGYIEIGEKLINIIVVDAKGLIYANSFECKNDNDTIYHILNVYEQLKLSPEINELYVSGDFNSQTGIFPLIKKFIRNVTLFLPSSHFTYSDSFSEIPQHIFTNLFNLNECE